MGTVALILMSMWQQRMSPEFATLTLAQWLSPAYPVGSFAYSHGLEAVIQQGTVRTADDLENWLGDVLLHGSGRNDCILLRAAYDCETLEDLDIVDEVAKANAPSAERQREAHLQGDAFGKTTAQIWGEAFPNLTYPVALGHAARQMQFPLALTAAMYLQAFASNLVSAAVRLVPLGQSEGQIVLAGLTPLCQQIAQDMRCAGLDALQSTAFLSDIAAMKHETLQPRIFRS